MAIYDINKIMNVEPLLLKNNIKGPKHKVKFSDGVVLEMNAGSIVANRYYLEFAKRLNMDYTSDLSITNKYANGVFTSGTHSASMSYMYKVYINKYLKPNNAVTFENMEASWKILFEILNNLYSELQYNVLEYGLSLTWLDYVELQKDPELIAVIEEGLKDKKNPLLIEKANKVVERVMERHPRNNISKLYRAKAVNPIQANQSVGRRGFTGDINNMIFPEAADINLTRGFMSAYDMMCEQPVMAKALDLAEQGIRYSEWLQRELHLSAMSIMSVLLDDCGNRYYHPWKVETEKELSLLEGTNILLDGVEQELDLDIHKNLVGTVIYMRRLNDCNHLKKGHVCKGCLGSYTYSMSKLASVSLTLITIAMSVIGQAMLSAKHFADSLVLKTILLKGNAYKYLTVEGTDFYIKKKSGAKYLYLSHASYHGFRLLYSSMADKVNSLDASKLSNVSSFFVGVEDGSTISKEYVEVRLEGRAGVLDKEFIKHTLSNTVQEGNDYRIDISNYEGRLLYLENKEFAFDEFNDTFKRMLTSYKSSNVDDVITQIFNYLNSKLVVNIKIVEVLVAAITAENITERDYNIGLDRESRKVTSYTSVINNRGIGVSLGFERQNALLGVPYAYLKDSIKPYNPLENLWHTKNIQSWSEK